MIEFKNVKKVYGNGVQALCNVSFNIENGEFVFFIGQSGAGKSTLIKLLTAEERPSSGKVVLDNFDVGLMESKLIPFLRRKIGMIFQDFRLIESKTVYENVAFAMQVVGASSRSIRRRVPIVLNMVGLRGKSNMYPNELSGGEAQRVGIARAMVNNPRLILADEPTGNLDPANGEAIMALLETINREGTTIIACTHDAYLVTRMKKRVIEIRDGDVLRDGYAAGYYKSGRANAEVITSGESRQPVRFMPNQLKMDESTANSDFTRYAEGEEPASDATEANNTAESKSVQISEALRHSRNKAKASLNERLKQVESLLSNHDAEKTNEANKNVESFVPTKQDNVDQNESTPELKKQENIEGQNV